MQCLLLHQVVIDKVGHEGDGDCAWTLGKDLRDLLVLQSDDILSVHLSQVVINKNSVPEVKKKQ